MDPGCNRRIVLKNSFLTILILAILIAAIGISSIYSSTYRKEAKPWREAWKRQLLWLIFALLLFIAAANLSYRWLWDGTYVLYGIAVLFLLLVFILGIVRLGAQRWLRIAWFNFQPSEFAKLIVAIFMARYFSKKGREEIVLSSSGFGIVRGLIIPFLFVAFPMALVIEQPDLGSGLMIFFLFIAMLYLTRVRLKYIVGFISAGLLLAPFLWHFLRGYQKDRLLVFLNPNIDPLGAGYTVIQSKIAIGSGGFFGKGWLSGTQSQLHFLPESHTDFIFATYAEEWGFLGCMVLFTLYYLLLRKGLEVAERTQDYFGKLLAYGITLLLGIQVFVNIAMNLGLAPVVGLPLPLMSYGGSSMIITFMALGILVNIDRTRAVF
ncbi:MAG: rod shape-determining protein RodA [Candidatus Omnitrophica bacterium]|nr:rod shape-determining protein RodA [Candidatus Omnitrophota bacterium]